MTRNNKNISLKRLIVFVLFLIVDLTFLYYIKYHNQSLSLQNISLNNIGNITNLFFYMIMIIGLVIIYFNKTLSIDPRIFSSIFIVNQILLLSCYVITIIELPFDKFYYLTQNGNRLFIGLIYTLYQFTFFVMFFLVWLNILKVKNLLVIRSMMNASWMMLFLLMMAFLFIMLNENRMSEIKSGNSKDGLAIVLGAAVWSDNKPSPTLAARVDKALELYDQGKVKSIYLTGGNAPGELSESQVALSYIKSKRKSTSDIFIETKTTSTNEQIQFIKKEILEWNKRNQVVVISDSYHLVRISEISDFHNLNIGVVPSDLPLSFEKALYFKVREALALIVFWFFAL